MVTISTTENLTDAGAIHAHLAGLEMVVEGVTVRPDTVTIDTEADEAAVLDALASFVPSAPPVAQETAVADLQAQIAELQMAVIDLLAALGGSNV